MISITSQLLTILLGTIFPAWLNCDCIKVLFSFVIISIVFSFVVRLLSYGGRK